MKDKETMMAKMAGATEEEEGDNKKGEKKLML